MQTQNNYDKDVYNGDIGSLAGLDLIEHTLTVDFDGRQVIYDWSARPTSSCWPTPSRCTRARARSSRRW